MRQGPLSSLTVVEFAGLGPTPFAAMMLADNGARVIRIDRPRKSTGQGGMESLLSADVLSRGRESIALDLKQPAARDVAMELVARADILIEGFRPGVMESLGLSPEACLQRRPSLIYTRVTGWGQHGPLAHSAGHDINYVALSGALHSTARVDQPPTPAPGLIGDFGGGGMLAAFGMLAAVLHARQTGIGQVVDVAVSDAAALLTALIQGWHSRGLWGDVAGTNSGDGGAHFYEVYRCADGKYVSVGAMEPQFYALLRQRCGLEDPVFNAQWDATQWPELKDRMAVLFASRTRAQWCELLEGTDACFAPVLDLHEATLHPHNHARRVFAEVDGVRQPSPMPGFSATPVAHCAPIGVPGKQTEALLREIGIDPQAFAQLLEGGAQPPATENS